MNEQDFKNKIDQPWNKHPRWNRQEWRVHQHKGRRWVGVFLLIIGGLLLARASGAYVPGWLFSWPMFLIGFGLLSGIRHNFRGFGWLIPMVIGGVFLIDEFTPDPEVKRYLWPVVVIAIGLLFIFRPKKKHWQANEGGLGETNLTAEQSTTNQESYAPSYQNDVRTEWNQAMSDGNDVIDATAVFGGLKKNVMSKNFRGGDVTTFMGGAEINLLQADFNGRVMIDCFNMFGGTKLIVPADWDVQSGLTTVFGGIEDKRQPSQINPAKVLYLDGTCIFGGVEIKSF